MRIITDLKEANVLLQQYNGAHLQITMYSMRLKRIALRIKLSNVDQILYLVGIGCESINGFFSYHTSSLIINETINSENDEPKTVISDEIAGFSLTTFGGFSLASGLESEFGTSFENFLDPIGNDNVK